VIVARDLYIFMHYYDATYYPPIPTYIRDQRIRARHAEGESLSELARVYGVSPQRIYQIIQPAKHA
jgi:Mor family transcriptional regulator